MLGEPFRRGPKASLDDLQKQLDKITENTGKTINIYGKEMNEKWAAVTLKNKYHKIRKKPKFLEPICDLCLGEHWVRNCQMKICPVCLFRGHSDLCVMERSQKMG